jgi:hypothetical protein
MDEQEAHELAPLFAAVGEALRQNQQALNQADTFNGNHGDHMVEIFEIAAQAARERGGASLAEAMEHASQLLEQRSHNGSAQVYAHGLRQMGAQFRHYQVTLGELIAYMRGVTGEGHKTENRAHNRSGDVLKALVTGLSGWSQAENGQAAQNRPLGMGALFELGMAYLQAKQRGGSRIEVLADAAASASPLSRSPLRYQSGRLAIQALLEAMQASG